MTGITKQGVAEIAAKLTDAQRARVIGMKRARLIYRERDWAAMQKLHALGLITHDWRVPYREDEYQMSAGLSRLGLALRAHLATTSSDLPS